MSEAFTYLKTLLARVDIVADTYFEKRVTQFIDFTKSDDFIEVSSVAGTSRFPKCLAGALDHISTARNFRPCDLPGLEPEAQILLCHTLVDLGLIQLHIANDAASDCPVVQCKLLDAVEKKEIYCGPAPVWMTPSRIPVIELLEGFLHTAGAQLGPDGYSRQVVDDGRVRPELEHVDGMLRAYADKLLLVLNNVHVRWPIMASVAAKLNAAVSCPVNANLYVSREGVPGLPPHVDPMEVVVLQLDGSKHWSVQERDAPLGARRHLHLRAGEVLYLPRGVRHSAWTNDQHSAHATFGLIPRLPPKTDQSKNAS